MKNLYLLIASLLFLVSSCEERSKPAPPEHKGYVFQHQTVVPEVEGEGCHEGYIEQGLAYLDNFRDARLAKYDVDQEEIWETSGSIQERVEMMFEHIPGKEQEQLSGILEKMRPFLSEEYQNMQVYLVRHRMVGGYINAFTFVGNNIYFSSGLFNATENWDEVAMVLGHEIGHHTNAHVIEAFRAKQKWTERLAFLGIETENRAKVAAVLEEFINKGLGQEDEIEADLTGMYLCAAAGYDPMLGAELFDTFSSFHNPNRSFWQRLRSSHPAPENRKECIESYLVVARDSADAVYAREMAFYNNELQAWNTSQWQRSMTSDGIPFAGLAFGFVLFLISRRRRVKPIVGLLGVVVMSASLGFLVVEHVTLPTFKSNVEVMAVYDSLCEYAEDGCNDVQSYATVTTKQTPLNVRSSPFMDSQTLTQVEKGGSVYCEYCSRRDNIGKTGSRWCYVVTNSGIKGWVWGDYLIVRAK